MCLNWPLSPPLLTRWCCCHGNKAGECHTHGHPDGGEVWLEDREGVMLWFQELSCYSVILSFIYVLNRVDGWHNHVLWQTSPPPALKSMSKNRHVTEYKILYVHIYVSNILWYFCCFCIICFCLSLFNVGILGDEPLLTQAYLLWWFVTFNQ